jgi:hypothetical protein
MSKSFAAPPTLADVRRLLEAASGARSLPTKVTPRLRRLSAAFAIVFGWTLIVSACASEVVHQKSLASPDGATIADWYELSGGGAAGWVVDRVRLRPSTEPFQADRDDIFSAHSAYPVNMRWISNNELEVAYDKRGTLTTSQPRWKQVAISYRAVQVDTK